MSLTLPKKPARWALSPGAVDPSWRWAWRGLVGAWPFWEGGGGQISSLVYPPDTVALTGSAFWSSDHAGMGLRVNAANLAGGIIKVPSVALHITDAVTILWCGVVYSDGNGSGSPALASLVPNSSDQAPYGSYGLVRTNGSPWHLSLSWNNGTVQGLTITNGISADGYGKDRVFAFAYDSHSAIGYRDGVQIGSTTTGLGMITYGSDPELLIGRHATNTSANTDSLTYLVAIWHRKLTDSEIALISRDPFGPFRMADGAGVVYAVPSGGTTVFGAVALSSTTTLSGTSVVSKLGQVALSAAASLSASATRTVLSAASLTSQANLAASGVRTVLGRAVLASTDTLATTARLTIHGVASLAATSTLTAAGVASRLGTAALSVSATVRVVVASAAIETVLARTRTLTVLATARARSVLATARTLAVFAVKRS